MNSLKLRLFRVLLLCAGTGLLVAGCSNDDDSPRELSSKTTLTLSKYYNDKGATTLPTWGRNDKAGLFAADQSVPEAVYAAPIQPGSQKSLFLFTLSAPQHAASTVVAFWPSDADLRCENGTLKTVVPTAQTGSVAPILAGKATKAIRQRASAAKFDERLSLLGLLLDAATGELRSVVEREEMLRELLGILKDVKAALTAPEADLAALLEEQLRRQKTRIDTGRRSGSLSQEAERSHRRIIAALERQKVLAGQTVDSQTGFAAVKADFDQMVQGLKAQAKTAGEMLNNLFAFCEEVFPEGQELLILVTELTINYYAATFISRYGCDAYFAHNQELLFYERQQEIISQLESLELN